MKTSLKRGLFIHMLTFSMCMQVCGNSKPVKLLSDWLHLWHEKASRTSKSSIQSDSDTLQDFSDSLYESEADSSNEERLKNVLLVSGPVGVCSLFLLFYKFNLLNFFNCFL